MHLPFSESQIFNVPSPLAEAINRPSGENETEVTHDLCFFRVKRHYNVESSQILTLLSWLPETTLLLSGEKSTEYTLNV